MSSSPAPFAKHTFVNPSSAGRRTGPSRLSGVYSGAPDIVKENVQLEDGVQVWSVPRDGKYRITARGAQGGSGSRSGSGGKGAVLTADFELSTGDSLYMLIGLEGRVSRNSLVGGGGGTFVWKQRDDNGLLLAAGGGGGYGVGNNTSRQSAAHARHDGVDGKPGWNGRRNISGGSGGAGGSADSTRGCGGGGWNGDGGGSSNGGGRAVKNGSGHGGHGSAYQDGSFGGGGAVNGPTTWGACGGGGGYSGGGGAYSGSNDQEAAGGGGGSYINTTLKVSDHERRQTGNSGGNDADGSVTVEFVPGSVEFTGQYSHDVRVTIDRQNEITQDGVDNDIIKELTMNHQERESEAQHGMAIQEMTGEADRVNNDFREVTDMVGQLNEAHGANTYIDDALKGEIARITQLNQVSKDEVQKTQIRQMALDYDINRSRFVTRVIASTIITSLLLSLMIGGWLQGALPNFAFIIITVVLLLGYALLVAYMYADGLARRKNNWQQKYHPGKDMKCRPKGVRVTVATLFEKCGFGGKSWNIQQAGTYDLEKSNMAAGPVAGISMRIGTGHAVRLFRETSGRDEITTVFTSIGCMKNHPAVFDKDYVRSIEVFQVKPGGREMMSPYPP